MESVIKNAVHIDMAFSESEKQLLEKARKMPTSFDQDCPETTPERALKFKRVKQDQCGCRKMNEVIT